jgi:hypothetical protein
MLPVQLQLRFDLHHHLVDGPQHLLQQQPSPVAVWAQLQIACPCVLAGMPAALACHQGSLTVVLGATDEVQ